MRGAGRKQASFKKNEQRLKREVKNFAGKETLEGGWAHLGNGGGVRFLWKSGTMGKELREEEGG